MIVRIATVGVVAAVALCWLAQPASAGLAVQVSADASAGIDDLCVLVTVTGMVSQTIGHCEPAGVPTNEFKQSVGYPGLVEVEVLLRA